MVKVTLLDLGGHREYESCLALLGRNKGLHVGVINPWDIENEEKLYASLWSWVEKVLDGAAQPHFILVVTKADESELKTGSFFWSKQNYQGEVKDMMNKVLVNFPSSSNISANEHAR